MDKFSVVTIVKGRRKQLRNLLDSISRSELLPNDIQIVAMDDGSDITGFNQLPVTVHILSNSEELPLAAARNKGFASVETDTVIFIDVDCIVSPTLFRNLLSQLNDTTIVAAYPKYLPYVPDSGKYYDYEFDAVEHPDRKNIEHLTKISHLKFWSLIFAIRRKSYDSIGGFDETFTGYGGEDTDFAMAFDTAGYTQLFIKDYVLHQYHSKYDPPLNHFHAIIRNAERYKDKWGIYPMFGWLTRFKELGLIGDPDITDHIQVIRDPSNDEIEATITKNPY